MSAIYEVLRQLDEWRHLPDYQLERRVDIFFGMFLPKVIEERFDVCVDAVVPEFPLRKGTLEDDVRGSNQSVKVDFAVFGHDRHHRGIYLVELKTDMGSLKPKQFCNMRRARSVGSKKLVEGVLRAAGASDAEHKYAHLIWKLLEVERSQRDNRRELAGLCLEKGKQGSSGKSEINSAFCKLRMSEKWNQAYVDLVAVLPTEPKESKKEMLRGIEVITFAEFANLLEDDRQPFGSPDASVFADYLRHWAEVEAGRVSPWPRQY